MTVTTTNSFVGYVGLGVGSGGPYAITFQYWDNSEIAVYVRTAATGALVLKSTPSAYTFDVHVGGTADGAITFTAGNFPLTTEEVLILRTTSQAQNVDFTPSVKFPSASAEEGLDRAAMRAQEALQAVEDRSLRIPRTDELVSGGGFPDMELPNTAARSVTNAQLGFNTSGVPIIVVSALPDTVTTTTFGDNWVQEASVASARGTLLADAAAARADISAIANGGSVAQCDAGTFATRPAEAAFGAGFYYATDTKALYYSDTVAWTEIQIQQFTNALVPATGTAGRLYLDTDQNILLRDNGSANVVIQSPWPRGSIGGLGISRSSATVLAIAAGEARCVLGTTGAINATIPAFTKDVSATFATLTGNGGVASGAFAMTANEWHYVFLCSSDAGVVDICIDDDPVGTNVLADAAIIAADLDENIRVIGMFRANASSQLDAWLQDGDHFRWVTPVLSYTALATDYGAGVNVALSHSPPGKCTDILAMIDAVAGADARVIYLEVAQTGAAPTLTTAPGSMVWDDGVNGIADGTNSRFAIWTDGSKQIYVHEAADADSAIDLHIVTHGWWDDRGQND